MLEWIKKLFGFIGNGKLQREYADLLDRHERLLDEYEELSAKYFNEMLPVSYGIPGVHLCSRRERDVYAFFRVSNGCDFDALSDFLGKLGWDRGVALDSGFETGLEVYSIRNGNGAKVDVPNTSVVLINQKNPKFDYLVVPEKIFCVEWNILR